MSWFNSDRQWIKLDLAHAVSSLTFQSKDKALRMSTVIVFCIHSMTNQSGRFSIDGITVTITNSTFVQCTSNHLTSFAVLVDVSGVSYT